LATLLLIEVAKLPTDTHNIIQKQQKL